MSHLLAYPFFVFSGFRVYDMTAGSVIYEHDEDLHQVDADDWAIPFSVLGLTPGRWLLGVSRFAEDGCESEIVTIAVQIGAGGEPAYRLREPTKVTAQAIAGGMVRVSWSIQPSGSDLEDPDEFEVAFVDHLETVATTVTFDRQRARYQATVGPITNGQTTRIAVRSTAEPDATSRWVESLPVVGDDQGPAAPALLSSVSGSC